MIEGSVNDDLGGEIQLTVIGPDSQIKISAWIDTGFSGFLTLNRDVINRLGLPWDGPGWTVLGDGRECVVNEYLADVDWDGSRRRVVVDEAEIKPLIGTGLLAGYKLEMEFQDGGVLRLESFS